MVTLERVSDMSAVRMFKVVPVIDTEKYREYGLTEEKINKIKNKEIVFDISLTGPQDVELIKLEHHDRASGLQEISERGYISAPSQYVAGWGIQFPEERKRYGFVTSIDQVTTENNFKKYAFQWNINFLLLNEVQALYRSGWWIAVIKKA